MKIAHLIYSFTTGGAETMLVDIMNEQVKVCDVSLVIINNVINEKLIDKLDRKIGIYRIGRKPSSKNPLPGIRLNRLLNKLNPAVIHGHNVKVIESLFGKNKKKTVLTVHDTNIRYTRFNEYKALFAISNAVKQDICNRHKLGSTLVYNGINLGAIRKKEEFDKSQDVPFRIVQIGRVEHNKKGQDLLIKALGLIIDKYNIKEITIDFIGEGSSMEYLKGLTEELQLNSYINFLGLKGRDYIYQHLADYSLLVQPSLYEGFGLTVAEAMAAGVPVLVSDIDGPMEIIQGGRYGYHFPSGQVDELAKAIVEIISKPDRAKAEEAYRHTLSCFSIEETARNYINEYKKL